MTVETEVANLTTAVDNLTSAVNVKKATLDASVADAEAAQSAAASSASTASGHALSAAASASAAAATASGISGFDLNAIATSKAVTAVDVFVYDTSKDSDGGAWRKRTQGTSWFNETLNTATRGSRREFPAVAVIVAETNKVTIYDGDDPSLPMWMVFGLGVGSLLTSFSSVFMRNGIMCAGSPANINFSGLLVARFLNDDAIGVRGHVYWNLHMNVPAISARNGTWQQAGSRGFLAYASSSVLVNPSVRDVAMTVLPDAPIDPATGLPVPTIAVATAGGVSVIKDDGTVTDSIDTYAVGRVAFTSEGYLFYLRNGGSTIRYTQTYASDGFQDKNWSADYPKLFPASANATSALVSEDGLSFGSTVNGGISLLLPNWDTEGNSAVANTTSTYNTGWMNGDIKGAFLSDTDDTDLVGSGELVTNGTFDTDTTGWTAGDSATLSVDTGRLKVTNGAAAAGDGYQAIPTVVGKRYKLSATLENGNAASRLYVEQALGGTVLLTFSAGYPTSTNVTGDFIAATTTTYVRVSPASTVSTEYCFADNISVKLADADRSVNNNGLIVNGTVTRTAVATGADLVAYSGFSSSNYLEQPYNSALDFGTGDFCVMGWGNPVITSTAPFLARGVSDRLLEVMMTSNSARIYCDNTLVINHSVTAINKFFHVAAVREAGVLYLYLDGVLAASAASTQNVTEANATLRLGADHAGSVLSAGKIALWRISATAPTAEQISRIYNDEKHLFVENAACTLAGTSDAVTALAHDSSTGLLHVGSSYGRSVFQGLRRVDAVAGAVGTAISAENGLVVSE